MFNFFSDQAIMETSWGWAGPSSAPAELSLDLIQWYVIYIFAATNAVMISTKKEMLRSNCLTLNINYCQLYSFEIVDDLENL